MPFERSLKEIDARKQKALAKQRGIPGEPPPGSEPLRSEKSAGLIRRPNATTISRMHLRVR